MSLKNRIQEDVKDAMRARDRERLSALRLISAAIKQKEVDERGRSDGSGADGGGSEGSRSDQTGLDDAQVLAVLDKMVKQRRESLQQFEAAGRDDLAARERFELEVIGNYLPQPLDESALSVLIDQVIAEVGATSARDMGSVMNALRSKVQGRADMKAVSQAVKARLG